MDYSHSSGLPQLNNVTIVARGGVPHRVRNPENFQNNQRKSNEKMALAVDPKVTKKTKNKCPLFCVSLSFFVVFFAIFGWIPRVTFSLRFRYFEFFRVSGLVGLFAPHIFCARTESEIEPPQPSSQRWNAHGEPPQTSAFVRNHRTQRAQRSKKFEISIEIENFDRE